MQKLHNHVQKVCAAKQHNIFYYSLLLSRNMKIIIFMMFLFKIL